MGIFAKLFGSGKRGRKIADVARRWDLRGRTGQGSMSKVFQAYDKEIGRTVCLKILDAEKTRKFEERFKALGLKKPSEGEICVQINHPNCVRTYEHGVTTKGEPYLVMEWIDGLGLNYLVETKSPQLAGQRIHFLGQLCDAIDYLHDQKFLHRDICPRNVMIAKEEDGPGVVKLIDFGLTVPWTPQFTQPGNRTGTVDYLAPEIIKRMATDHRVDLFALGVTAYEVFTGAMPWERTPSSEETLRRRINLPPRDVRDVKKGIEEDLAKVLMKMIAKDRTERFSSAKLFKEALLKLDRQDY